MVKIFLLSSYVPRKKIPSIIYMLLVSLEYNAAGTVYSYLLKMLNLFCLKQKEVKQSKTKQNNSLGFLVSRGSTITFLWEDFHQGNSYLLI